jgi:aspartate kinase
LDEKVVPVVTGFVAATQDGILTTLGRGGSDYTAAILGDSLDASEVWTWTDVDGVMTADPRIVSNARVIPELSFSEVSELAYFGAKVLHPKTLRPIIERDIPLWVKNTFNPESPGTKVIRTSPSVEGKVTAISTIRDLSLVTVEGRGMLGIPGIAARTFAAVARQGASVLMISQASSEQSICFVIPTQAVPAVIQSIESEMELELSRRDIDRVWAQPEIVIVTAVGAGLRHTPGIAGRIFSALGESGINVIAIAQGSSEYSISIVVAAEDADDAMRKIHQEVILNG